MKRIIKKLESLTNLSFLQVSDAKAIYGQVSTVDDVSLSFDSSASYDKSNENDYSIVWDS